MTVDPEIPVPPVNYGGIERIVSSLSKEYTKLGHEVFLMANPGSTEKSAVEIYGWKGFSSRNKKDIIANTKQLYRIAKKIKPDVIHSFSRLLYLYPNFLFSKIPVVQTYQRKISIKSTTIAIRLARKKINFTSCSKYMHENFKNIEKWNTVYNFTDTNYFIHNDALSKEHLMFLGRIEDIKGTKEAIEVALATNNKLIIAGNIQEGHDAYFNQYIKPHLNSSLIKYVGSVNDEQKLYYLQRAKAFLFPVKWEEPFGIVMAEAMSCGVPVIGFGRGSVPEVVKNEETGYIVDNVDEMINAVKNIDKIDRNKVRNDCVERFSLEVIAKQYLDLFEKAINK